MTDFIIHQWWLVLVVLASLVPLALKMAREGIAKTLSELDRRWVFLLMLWAVLVPIYFIGVTGATFPEVPSALSEAVFDEIEKLNAGDPVLLSFDYDPASQGELAPMATAFVKHGAEKKLKMYFIALWPVGAQRRDNTIDKGIK